MLTLKEKIIISALKLFAEKGFHATNVQEIANHAGVAKGTLYAHFTSKKNILISIYGYYLDCLYNSLDVSMISNNQPFEERLITLNKVLNDYLSVAFEHENFLKMQMKEQNINDPQIMEFIQEKRGKIYIKFQQLMTYVGGEELKNCVLDVAVILNSLIEEYSAVVILDGADIPVEELVNFITQTITCILKGFKNKYISPILSENYMKNKEIREEFIYTNKIKERLSAINQLIHNIYFTQEEKQEVNASLILINDELSKNNPDIIIIKGMLRNIGRFTELEFIVDEIFSLLQQIKKDF
ncbi:TetR family transcriptional regulator (plasmid) [Bacillus cereus]|nr:TetR family transcriptional regulator [Bacillus cereus]